MLTIEQIKSINELECMIYQYIIDNQEKVLQMKIKELSQEIHVSPTTIIRFCKKVGCDGFAEFKIRYRLYLSQSDPIANHQDISIMMNYFNSIDRASFYEKLAMLSDKIKKKNHIIFAGVGTSGVLAEYAARYFTNMGKISFSITDPFYPILHAILKDSVAIILSESGETQQSIEHARAFKEAGCFVICITNQDENTLQKLSDASFTYYVPSEKTYNTFTITTQVPVLFILESLGKQLLKESNV